LVKNTLPYDVSRTQALENDRVMKIFVQRLKDLRSLTDRFLNAIVASLPKMPYSLRYITSQIRLQLETKFPQEEDKEKITKIIGNLIYYRYMNPALVAPEGFDVINTMITPRQRKSLAEISRILQQMSVGKLFDDEYFYLTSLNQFITSAKVKFYKFFHDSATAISPEEHFRIDEYYDFAKSKQPSIYISQEEIFSTYALLLENLDEMVAQKEDPLRAILKDIPNPPKGSAKGTNRGAGMTLSLTNVPQLYERGRGHRPQDPLRADQAPGALAYSRAAGRLPH